MAVRFTADGEDFTRALGLGVQAAFTVTCWMYLSANTGSWATAWSIDAGSGDVDLVQTDSDGVSLNFYSDGDSTAIDTLTVGTWYFVAVARSGTGGTAYIRAEGAPALQTAPIDGASSGATFTTLRLGESPFSGEWLNGRLAAVKVWTAQLNQTEVEAEAATYDAVRTTNLYGAWFRPDVALSQDYSGNGNTLSGGSGATVEAGPAELDTGGAVSAAAVGVTVTPQPPVVAAGGVVVAATPTGLSLVTQPANAVAGAVTVQAQPVQVAVTAQAASTSTGAGSVAAAPAAIGVAPQPASTVASAVDVQAGAVPASVTVQPATVTAGPVTVQAQPVDMSATVQAAGPQTVRSWTGVLGGTATQPVYGGALVQPTYGGTAATPTYGGGIVMATHGGDALVNVYGGAATPTPFGGALTGDIYGGFIREA